jgi:phosphohistidine phosphatase
VKKLFLVRHAKSSWSFPELDDFERPLNKRGKRDAPFMGKLLKEKKIKPDLLLSSPAVRAYITARTIAGEIKYPVKKLQTNELLYHGSIKELIVSIKKTDKKNNSLMVFGHNPGLTEFSNYLTDKYLDNIPTCGIVEIDLRIDDWIEIDEDSGTFINFEYPKKYIKQ